MDIGAGLILQLTPLNREGVLGMRTFGFATHQPDVLRLSDLEPLIPGIFYHHTANLSIPGVPQTDAMLGYAVN